MSQVVLKGPAGTAFRCVPVPFEHWLFACCSCYSRNSRAGER